MEYLLRTFGSNDGVRRIFWGSIYDHIYLHSYMPSRQLQEGTAWCLFIFRYVWSDGHLTNQPTHNKCAWCPKTLPSQILWRCRTTGHLQSLVVRQCHTMIWVTTSTSAQQLGWWCPDLLLSHMLWWCHTIWHLQSMGATQCRTMIVVNTPSSVDRWRWWCPDLLHSHILWWCCTTWHLRQHIFSSVQLPIQTQYELGLTQPSTTIA